MRKLLAILLVFGLCFTASATDLSSIYSNLPQNKLSDNLDTNGFKIDGSTTDGYLVLRGDSGATDDFKLYDSGIIDFPKQSGCRVHRITSAQTLTSGTVTKIEWNSEDYDNQNEFDSTTNYRFTATKAGTYSFKASVRLTNPGDGTRVLGYLRKNGSDAGTIEESPGANQYQTLTVSTDIKLAVNDYLEYFILQLSGGDVDTGYTADVMFMSITKIQ